MPVSTNSMITPPEANAAEQSRMELQAKLNGLGGLNGRQLDPEAKAKKLREACQGFESIFIQKMWQEMRNTVPKSNLFSGREEKFWQDMYDQELSKSMTSAGGIGLADMMYDQLSRGLADASSRAAAATGGSAFVPQAAPLIMPVAEMPQAVPASQTMPVAAASIYDGEAPASTVPAGEEESKLEVPVARKQNLRHAETTTRQPGSAESTLGANNGLQQAYFAKREAGDKLSSHGIRPAMRSQKKQAAPVEEAQPVQAAFAPGSAQSLSAAIDLAKTGAPLQSGAQTASISDMVNAAKTRNAMQSAQSASQPASAQTFASAETDQPVVRKTRFTTNIPKKTNTKKGGDAIRLLNVDNKSVNSRQGAGLAAYHKQQEQAQALENAAQTAPVSPLTAAEQAAATAPAAPISPLTAADASSPATGNVNFAIPPLKPGQFES